MNASDHAIDLIKSFEGLSLSVYTDSAGYNSIGYGHKIQPGEMFSTITEDEALEILSKDLTHTEAMITRYITAELNQNQYDATCSLVFNCGSPPLTGHFGTYLNAGSFDQAAGQILEWCHSGQDVVQGLLRRRRSEYALFTAPVV